MRLFIRTFILTIFTIGLALAQFKASRPGMSVPTNLNGELDYSGWSLFDPNRFDMQHGFSMSMMNIGGQSVSVAGYTNNLTYWAKNNLRLDANILLYQPAINTVQGGLAPGSSLKTVYDVGLIYAPTKNSFLELRFQNAPYYQSYQSQSPFHLRMR